MTKLLFGTGQYIYEVIQPFGNLPTNMNWGVIGRVAVDSQGNVYVSRRGDPPILIFDSHGKFLSGFGQDLLIDPHGMFFTKNDELFVADRDAHEVIKLNHKLDVILRIGTRENARWQAPFNHPADVAVSPSGEIYVADGYGNSSIHKFSDSGEYLLSWGVPGTEPGEFSTPHGIWIDSKSRVYVADRENSRVQIFDTDGRYITEWIDLYHPMDIWFDDNDIAFVSDQTPRFSVLDQQGKLLSRGKAPDAGLGLYGASNGDLYLSGTFPGAAPVSNGIVKFIRQ